MKLKSVFFFAAILFLSADSFASISILKCSKKSTEALKTIMIQSMQYAYTPVNDSGLNLNSTQIANLEFYYSNVKIKCTDSGVHCGRSQRGTTYAFTVESPLGFTLDQLALGSTKGTVFLCEKNLINSRTVTTDCGLSEIIYHEVAHLAQLKSGPNHNRGNRNDQVYKFSAAIKKSCLKSGY
jgi:hypothetical protein